VLRQINTEAPAPRSSICLSSATARVRHNLSLRMNQGRPKGLAFRGPFPS
jgi:hypothetical protein